MSGRNDSINSDVPSGGLHLKSSGKEGLKGKKSQLNNESEIILTALTSRNEIYLPTLWHRRQRVPIFRISAEYRLWFPAAVSFDSMLEHDVSTLVVYNASRVICTAEK